MLICKDKSSVIVESVGFEEYTEDIIPRFFASLAYERNVENAIRVFLKALLYDAVFPAIHMMQHCRVNNDG